MQALSVVAVWMVLLDFLAFVLSTVKQVLEVGLIPCLDHKV